MAVLLDLMQQKYNDPYSTEFIFSCFNGSALESWINGAFTKICVYVNSEEELKEVYKKAKEAKLLCSIIEDSGQTEFNNVPTLTAVAIGPHYPSDLNPITGHLPLL